MISDNVAEMSDMADRLQLEKTLIENLPKANRVTLRRLVELLVAIRDQHDKNKMTSNNLAIVFGHNLLRSIDDDPGRMLADAAKVSLLKRLLMLKSTDQLCGL